MPSEKPNDALADALALVPSGCCILTCVAGAESTGMLASWVQQAAFEPPMVTVAVKRSRPAADLIDRAGRFTLNVLGENPGPLFKHFGAGFAPGEPAFEGLACTQTDHGVDLAEATGVLSCRVASRADAGDHVLYIAEVEQGRRQHPGKPYVHIRKNGFSY